MVHHRLSSQPNAGHGFGQIAYSNLPLAFSGSESTHAELQRSKDGSNDYRIAIYRPATA
jgi:hypothetical protein